jgi:ribosomal protein L37AE/L43A
LIIKDRIYPIRLRMYEALFNRLKENCSRRGEIEGDYKGWRAGYKGELQTDYRLSFLPEKDYWILRDLRLRDEMWHFQIDTLIITHRYILLVETKNYSGTIYFEKDSEQMIQTKLDKEKAYDNPILQVKKQKWHLKRWLVAHKFKVPPIFTMAVISNPATIIKTNDPKLYKYVVKGDVLVDRIKKMDSANLNDFFPEKEIKKLSKTLVKKHTPLYPELLKTYSLTETDLHKGVQCPSCSAFGMRRMKRKWVCHNCSFHSRTAHLTSVVDFFLLIKPSLTNSELSEFLLIQNPRAVGNILSSMNLPISGSNKGCVYHMPEDMESFIHLAQEKYDSSHKQSKPKKPGK